MNGELRALGLAHGLLLGLLLASPMVAPGLLPWGIDALLLVGGFELRLADRRFTLRPGVRDWFSHIRMAPARLIRWVAAAVVALIAGRADLAIAIMLAALACELLAYPLGTLLFCRRTLPATVAILMLLIAAAGLPGPAMLHLVASFLAGVMACMVWLRGPDGEPRTLAIALGGGLSAAATALYFPEARPFAAPGFTICMLWTLAHLSVLRRPIMPWHLSGAPVRPLSTVLRLLRP
ncbi:hypothetical protein Q4610_04065 [Sphingobium sp. HBC34]|uniref:Uncharacterized protein n=1 Tax=Sphingobium cyanobacteriorum TaxID=3063954 RepID=A0ABT8ZI62_9SPHN|nr:hypothetical protein [Sphingobium sp. HBC34]MDO7834214.1 hypothetical protein [Sphingobium sp. HBC34]